MTTTADDLRHIVASVGTAVDRKVIRERGHLAAIIIPKRPETAVHRAHLALAAHWDGGPRQSPADVAVALCTWRLMHETS